MKAYEVLEQKGHCKGTFARNANGKPIGIYSSSACSFCAAGAIHLSYPDTTEAFQKISLAGSYTFREYGKRLSEWNDLPDTTKEQVVTLLKELDV